MTASGIDLMDHQASPGRETTLRRRYIRDDREVPLRSHVAQNKKLLNKRQFFTRGVTDTNESEYDEKMADVEALGSNGLALGGVAEKV